jgi:methylated-DNA-[protein]-cysteine S-methyltransferase
LDAVEDKSIQRSLQESIQLYFVGVPGICFKARLVLDGLTDFQKSILRACRAVGYGKTVSYGELAKRAGYPGAARAVGSVMARNRHPLITPCHRVVAAGNRIGGFSSCSGTELKRAMLELEGATFRA